MNLRETLRGLLAAAHRPKQGQAPPARSRLALVAHGIHHDGGMERNFAELLKRVHDRYAVVVISSELAADLRPLVEWRRTPAPRRPAVLRFLVFYVLGALQVRRARADLVHTIGAIVPNGADVASVQFCHAGFRDAAGGFSPPGAPPLRRLNTAVYRFVCIAAERWSYRPGRSRVLSPVSHGVARELERHYPGVPREIAPNGVDRRRFGPDEEDRKQFRRRVGVGEDELVALFVGGDWDRKGLAIALDGLAHARELTTRPFWLWVVGDGDEARFRRVAARRPGLEERICFFGRRRDTERFYRSADFFVFPTFYEAFPLVALEAASSGLPIVATSVNGVEELVGEDEAGIAVERSGEAVGEALASLADDPDLRARLGARALARSAEFTWERSAGAAATLYEAILAEAALEAAAV
jgi:glycosyltransferase involved in cell wall biosynthesis